MLRRLPAQMGRAFAGVVHIHSRASQTTLNQRARQLLCPSEYRRDTRKSDFVLSPTRVQSPGRSKKTASVRKRIQLARSSSLVLKHLEEAIAENSYDASVFGAAFQKCGQSRWWDELLIARRMQCECSVKLFPVEVSIFLKALKHCVRDEDGEPIGARRSKVVQLGREAWQEHAEQDMISTVAALWLCGEAECTTGMSWATELLDWAEEQHFEKNTIWHNAVVTLHATHGSAEHVDKLLSQASHHDWRPNRVTLGCLASVYAEKRDWQRVEALWSRLTVDGRIQPGVIETTARAKAHFLCGRPFAAVGVLDEVLDELSGESRHLYLPSLTLHVQSLLICFHSNRSSKLLKRLQDAVQRGDVPMESASSRSKREWAGLKRSVNSLRKQPQRVLLHSILQTRQACHSAMSEWPNYRYGSNYLQKHV